jgi:hypothetical protein
MSFGNADNIVDIIENKYAHALKYVVDEVRYMYTGLGTMKIPEQKRGVDIVAAAPLQAKIFYIKGINM